MVPGFSLAVGLFFVYGGYGHSFAGGIWNARGAFTLGDLAVFVTEIPFALGSLMASFGLVSFFTWRMRTVPALLNALFLTIGMLATYILDDTLYDNFTDHYVGILFLTVAFWLIVPLTLVVLANAHFGLVRLRSLPSPMLVTRPPMKVPRPLVLGGLLLGTMQLAVVAVLVVRLANASSDGVVTLDQEATAAISMATTWFNLGLLSLAVALPFPRLGRIVLAVFQAIFALMDFAEALQAAPPWMVALSAANTLMVALLLGYLLAGLGVAELRFLPGAKRISPRITV